MLLSEILKRLSGVVLENFAENEIKSITNHSLDCSEETIFAVCNGFKNHGKNYIKDAINSGNKVFLCDEETAKEMDGIKIISKNVRKTMAEISKILFNSDIKKLTIIGITGTKGKTTTAEFMASILNEKTGGCISISTLGIRINKGEKIIEYHRKIRKNTSQKSEQLKNEDLYTHRGIGVNTTPDSYIIYEALAYASSLGIRYAIIEVSSSALKAYRVHGIPFFMCLFTNISKDHIGPSEHLDYEEYKACKRMLFSDYGARYAVVNADSEEWRYMSAGIENIITISKSEKSCVKFELLSSGGGKTEFMIDGKRFVIPIEGEFNAYNAAMAAVSAGVVIGCDIEEFYDVIKRTRIEGRYDIYEYHHRLIIIDFAHNEASFEAVLSYAKTHSKGRVIALFGSVGERNFKRRRELAKAAEKYADILIITSDNPGYEDAMKICTDIALNLDESIERYIVPDRHSAILRALDISIEDDVILLLGKGHEQFQKIGGEYIPFSERGIILGLGAIPLGS